jgi:hypothetical protein
MGTIASSARDFERSIRMSISESSALLETRPRSYEPVGTYRGAGSVFSERLNGNIVGDFEIEWDELGKCEIRCRPRNLHPFFSLFIAQDFDLFREIHVKCETGVFHASRCFLDKTEMQLGENGNGSKLVFVTLEAVFSLVTSQIPTLWNAPVLNFLMDLRPALEERSHPLQVSQLFSTVDAPPEDVGSEPARRARRHIVSFPFFGKSAFIEHLPHYEDAKLKLSSGEESLAATSLIAGEIPTDADLSLPGVKAWFPSDAILALTLATGTDVSLGFIELRDHQGCLCQRLHINFINGPYKSGHRSLSDLIHSDYGISGVGALIAGMLALAENKQQVVRRLIDTIATAQSFLQNPEHAFAFIVRGLDGLANSLQLARTNLSDNLSEPEATEVRMILRNAKRAIEKLSKRRDGQVGSANATLLNRIASRTEHADAIEDSFGLSITRVLKHFDLHDQVAIEEFYRTYPRVDGITWNQALNKYRGGVIHRGFLDYSSDVLMDDVVCCTRHLIDIAIRICFRVSGYEGTYNPFNRAAMQRNEVGWVIDGTSIGQFGFNGRIPNLFKTVGLENISLGEER